MLLRDTLQANDSCAEDKMQISTYTGADYEYNYSALNKLSERTIAQHCSSLRKRFSAQKLTDEAAEQWIARSYIAVKYLLAASVMLTSAEFASKRNLRIVGPYLLYYSLFNSSRTLFLMIPEQEWKDGGILDDPTHTKVQNVVCDQLRYISPTVSETYRDVSRRALATREMLSYSFPAEGLRGPLESIAPTLAEIINLCKFIAETAQLYSECMESALRSVPEFKVQDVSEPLRRFYEYELRTLDASLVDHEDYYRLGQFVRHSSKPWSLYKTAREGLVEDFFGAWLAEEEFEDNIDQYDPDKNWHIIFDFQ